MNDVAAVLTYKRDPLCYLCLEAIRKQDTHMPIVLISDRGQRSPDLEHMALDFNADLYVLPERPEYGNSFAVFMAMYRGLSYLTKTPAMDDLRIVHFIEDDTIIHPGFLDWARHILAGPMFSVALARIPGDIASTWYESPCASWDADDLVECLELIPRGYCEGKTREEMQRIADAAFPKSAYRYGSAEQDGFFLRAIEHLKLKTAYPPKSFASHIGWYGYNRPPGMPVPTGSFESQIEQCREILHNQNKRSMYFGDRITKSEMAGM